MASSLIHISLANEVNKVLKRDKEKLLIGSIAPDISKLIGLSRSESHFIDDEVKGLPNLEKFLNKYKNYLDDDFVMGYYIHLYTDYLWFRYFMTEINNKGSISTLDGKKLELTDKEYVNMVYNDYTNLNIELIDKYNLDCKIFYNELPKFDDIIKEIPMDKLDVIVNQTGIILENSEKNKEYLFDISNIEKFIETSKKIILSNIDELLKD